MGLSAEFSSDGLGAVMQTGSVVLVKPSYALPECLHRTGRTGDSRSPTTFTAGRPSGPAGLI